MGLLSPQVSKTGLMAALAALAQQQQPGAPQQTAPDPMANAKNPTPAPQQGLLAPQQPPQRERVSGWRLIDRVLGGQTITEGLDAERERLTTEAMRPQMMAREERLRGFAQSMGPAAEIAFETNRPEFGASLGQQYRPMAAAEGTAIQIPGTGQTFTNERRAVVGDRIVGMGTADQGPRDLMTVQPSYDNETQRAKAQAEAAYQAGRLEVDRGQLGVQQGQLGINKQVADQPSFVNTPAGGITSALDPNTGAVRGQIQGNPVQSAGRNGAAFDATTRGELSTARTASGTAARRINDARRFIALNQNSGTGLGAALLGPAAALSPQYAEMRAISASLIPKEREPGSGPMSDRDVLLYGRSVIDIDKPGTANQAIANAVIAQGQRDIEYSAFLDEYAQRNGNNVGATEDWTAYVNANPLFSEGRNGVIEVQPVRQSWREFMGFGERQRGGSGGQGQSGGQRLTPEQAQSLAPGTPFVGMDGVSRVRR